MNFIAGTSNIATSYELAPALAFAVDARGRANSVILGEPPLVRDVRSLISGGLATLSRLAVLPIDADAETRFERVLAANRPVTAKIPLKAK